MATQTIKSTYSLDVESVNALEALAQRWKVSKSEVLRRAIRRAAMEWESGSSAAPGALDQLQASLRKRKVNVTQWARTLNAERQAATPRLSSKSQ